MKTKLEDFLNNLKQIKEEGEVESPPKETPSEVTPSKEEGKEKKKREPKSAAELMNLIKRKLMSTRSDVKKFNRFGVSVENAATFNENVKNAYKLLKKSQKKVDSKGE